MTKPLSVLVLDGDMASSLTIARSLNRKGIQVDMCSHVSKPVSRRSRAVHAYQNCPSPLDNPLDFSTWLLSRLSESDYDLVIPVTERTIIPIMESLDLFRAFPIAIAAKESLEMVLDKAKTFELASQLGLNVPSSKRIDSISDLDHVNHVFPVVIKPARSIGHSSQIQSQISVRYAFNDDELKRQVSDVLHYGSAILQERVSGKGVGVEVLAFEGDVLYAFCHERMHEVPLTGGGSSLRKSIPMNPALLDAAGRLIRALRWHGVAMVEFKHDPIKNRYYLMEVNGRFWGSLPLAEAAGADFPGMLFDMLVHGQKQFLQTYREHIYCRHLARDVHWYELALRKAAPMQLKVIPSHKQMLMDLLLIFSPRHRFDVQRFSDPVPGLLEVLHMFASYWKRFKGIISERIFLKRQIRMWKTGVVQAKMCQASRVIFVCYGNINRSAIAEVYARSLGLEQRFEICSVGFHPSGKREMDMVMQNIAKQDGLDVGGFHSTCIYPNMFNNDDVILVMEPDHYSKLSERFPEIKDRIYLLGATTSLSVDDVIINDPYGLPEKVYRDTYNRIKCAVNTISKQTKTDI